MEIERCRVEPDIVRLPGPVRQEYRPNFLQRVHRECHAIRPLEEAAIEEQLLLIAQVGLRRMKAARLIVPSR